MSTINEARPYELLIRWDHLTGDLKGSHLVRCQVVIIDGEVVVQKPLDPEPVPAADTGTLWGLLDHTTASALATVERTRGQLAASEAALDEARSVIATKTAEVETLQGVATDRARTIEALQVTAADQAVAVAGLEETVADLRGLAAERAAAIAGLEERVAALQAQVDAAAEPTGPA